MKVILRSLLIASLFFPLFNQLDAETGEELMSNEKMKMIEQRREKFHQKRLEKLSQELELSKVQEEKISEIMKEGWEKIREEMRKMKGRVLAIRKDSDSQIEELLTPEQLEEFKELKEEFRERREKRIREHYKKREE